MWPRKSYAEARPKTVALAKEFKKQFPVSAGLPHQPERRNSLALARKHSKQRLAHKRRRHPAYRSARFTPLSATKAISQAAGEPCCASAIQSSRAKAEFRLTGGHFRVKAAYNECGHAGCSCTPHGLTFSQLRRHGKGWSKEYCAGVP